MLAAWGDGPGCGLGKMLFEREPKSILMQHLGSTSNVPSQPFGISSGTSGCTNNGKIVKEEQATVFASLNFENLSQEMAQGRGALGLVGDIDGRPPRPAVGILFIGTGSLPYYDAGRRHVTQSHVDCITGRDDRATNSNQGIHEPVRAYSIRRVWIAFRQASDCDRTFEDSKPMSRSVF